MIKLDKVLSNRFLSDLVRSTISGIEQKDCFYDQLHYVNRKFVDANFDQLRDMLVNCLAVIHPGIVRDDIAYVNDFVAPVNLANASIRQVSEWNKRNEYTWHIDTIDESLGPCYNLWIPLFRSKAREKLDNRPLFEVITSDDMPDLYDKNGIPRSNYLNDSKYFPKGYLQIIHQLTSVDMGILNNSFIYHDAKGKIRVIPKNHIRRKVVRKPDMGDAFVFRASQYHATGPSQFERIGISIKFIVTNPNLGFRECEEFRAPMPFSNWAGLFIGCYSHLQDFTSFREYLEVFIIKDQINLKKIQDKLDHICMVLKEIQKEINHPNE